MNTDSSSNAAKNKWSVDTVHSELSFKSRYLMISILTGYIKSFHLDVKTLGDDFGEVTDIHLTADMMSLTTRHEARDEHLKSKDFFDVERHPYLKFQSINFEKQGQRPPSVLSAYRRDYKLSGNLIIKGNSRLIVLNGEFGGISTDLSGQKRAGFTVRGQISRKEFGLTWEGLLDSGKLIVADEVDIEGNIQLIKQG
jgi:polyisoprenoid-binding protein YceI